MTPTARRGGIIAIAIASTLLLTTAVTNLTRAADPVVQRVSIGSGSGRDLPSVSGDGTVVAFQSNDRITLLDVNVTSDAFLRTLASSTVARMTVAVTGGTEATGTHVDSDSGLTVPQSNGADAMMGDTARYVVFSSNGDHAQADDHCGDHDGRPLDELGQHHLVRLGRVGW